MTRWFRFYDEALNDPKILKLSDNLFRVWVGILCVASKNEGQLPSLEDLCLMIRIKPEKMTSAIESLVKSGLIDDDGVSLSPHNWNGRQYKSDTSNDRVKRYRERQCNVTVTPPDTEQIQSRTETSSPVAKATRTKQTYSDEFEQSFWKPYPRTSIMSKQEAWREWMKLRPEQRSASCQALPAYLRHLAQNPTLQAVHACRFLSQNRAEGILELAAEKPTFDVRKHMI